MTCRSLLLYEGLPLEIHHNILLHASTPEDVYATIRASPNVLNAFLTGRERILITVLENSLAPEVFHAMLAILNVPKYENFAWDGASGEDEDEDEDEEAMKATKWQAWIAHMKAFCRSYVDGTAYSVPGARKFDVQNLVHEVSAFKTQVEALVRLYGITMRQVKAFQAFSLSIALGQTPNPPIDARRLYIASACGNWPALNPGEKLRLQRAFLRYELCCRLTGVSSMAAMADVALNRQRDFRNTSNVEFWKNPVRGLPCDEIEEIMIARTFVRDAYEMIHGSICKDLLRSINTHALPSHAVAPTSVKSVRQWLRKTLGEHIDFFSPRDGQVHASIDMLSRLGLCFLQEVLRSSFTAQRDLFRIMPGVSGYKHAPAAPDFLGLDRYMWRRRVGLLGFDDRPWDVVLGKDASPIVRTFSRRRMVLNTTPRRDQDTLRRMGWALFDEERRCRTLGLPSPGDLAPLERHQLPGAWARVSRVAAGKPELLSVRVAAAPELEARLAEDDYKRIMNENYSTPLLVGCDENGPLVYTAKGRLLAQAKAVIDGQTAEIPTLESVCPGAPLDFTSLDVV